MQTRRSCCLNAYEECDQSEEIDNIEQSIIVYMKNLLKRESDELKVLKSSYKRIQPYYEFVSKFMVCKKDTGIVAIIHIDITQLDMVKNPEKDNRIIFLISPNIEYAYNLINQRFFKKKKVTSIPNQFEEIFCK